MKKIVCLFVLGILGISLGGCYDYNELNELAIIVGLGIDYKDNEYVVTYEVLSNNVDKEAANTKAYTVSEKNEAFPKAIDLTADVLPKKAYFSHTDLLVLSTDIAEYHMEDIIDYLLRNKNIRETLNVVVVDDAKKFLSSTGENLAVISKSVNDTITSDKTSGSYGIEKKYIDLVREILSFGEDAAISKVAIDKEKVILEGLVLFDDYKMVGTLSKEEAAIFNLLNNTSFNVILDKEFDDKLFSTSVYRTNINIEVTNKIINITGNVEATVLENQPNFNLKDAEIINKLESTFKYVLNEKITELIKKLQEYKADILYLGEKYYIKSREKNNKLWENAKINANVTFNISKKGIIYEVKDAN